jgi:hypothetical protein
MLRVMNMMMKTKKIHMKVNLKVVVFLQINKMTKLVLVLNNS